MRGWGWGGTWSGARFSAHCRRSIGVTGSGFEFGLRPAPRTLFAFPPPNGKYLGKFLWKCLHVFFFLLAPPHGHDSAPIPSHLVTPEDHKTTFQPATANQKTRFLLLISRLGGTKTSSPDFVTLSASENKGGSASGAKPWRSFDLERERGAEARVLRSMLLR